MEHNYDTSHAHMQAQARTPYPEIAVERKNLKYAELMLSDMGGANSEMSAICLYTYNVLVSSEHAGWPAQFHQIAIDEMRHLEILGKTARLLGADPRWWERSIFGMRYWDASYVRYPDATKNTVKTSIRAEIASIEKYRNQLKIIRDKYIRANIERIIEDEERHLDIFRKMI